MIYKQIYFSLLQWYNVHQRSLPWRTKSDPYYIWISEIIMQQTQISRGKLYYQRFIERFPNNKELANASEKDVLLLWQGLGYYSRARNLHAAAQQIENEFMGVFPKTYDNIIQLKGVGDYTASAIASIAFGESVPAIDGNALRVISRLFNMTDPVDSSLGRNSIRSFASQMIGNDPAGDFNQAVMDFGSMVCKPKNPLCSECVLQQFCVGNQKNNHLTLPKKKIKIKKRTRYLYFFVLKSDLGLCLLPRMGDDIWKGLFEFPNVEYVHDEPISIVVEQINEAFGGVFDKETNMIEFPFIKHILTHQILYIKFIGVTNFDAEKVMEKYKFYDVLEVTELPLPKPIENFLSKESVYNW